MWIDGKRAKWIEMNEHETGRLMAMVHEECHDFGARNTMRPMKESDNNLVSFMIRLMILHPVIRFRYIDTIFWQTRVCVLLFGIYSHIFSYIHSYAQIHLIEKSDSLIFTTSLSTAYTLRSNTNDERMPFALSMRSTLNRSIYLISRSLFLKKSKKKIAVKKEEERKKLKFNSMNSTWLCSRWICKCSSHGSSTRKSYSECENSGIFRCAMKIFFMAVLWESVSVTQRVWTNMTEKILLTIFRILWCDSWHKNSFACSLNLWWVHVLL